MYTMNEIVVILSGGIDSTTLLWYLQAQGYILKEALTFNYGQRHSKELVSAKSVVKQFNDSFEQNLIHRIIDISTIKDLISAGSLTGDKSVPKDFYDKESQKTTIVPNRNAIMLSIAVGRAVTINARYVAYAAHASDYSVYPDCRPEFIDKFDEAMYLGNLWTPVNILAPFKTMSKTQVVTEGLKLNIPYELTWSCYEGKESPCLECGTCLERTEAFLENQKSDPSLTSEQWDKAQKLYRKHKSE